MIASYKVLIKGSFRPAEGRTEDYIKFKRPGWVVDTSTSSVANRIPDIHRDAAKLPNRINAAEVSDTTKMIREPKPVNK